MTTATLGDVAQYVNGAAFAESDWGDEGRRIIRIQNLNDPSKPYNRTTREVKDTIVVRPGDLLVSWSASLGVYEWSEPDEAVLNQHIFRVIPDESAVAKPYLRRVLEASLAHLERQVHGATMKHLTRGVFLETPIPLPPIEEQRRIATVLDAADALRAKRRQALAKLDTLTQATFIEMFGEPVSNPHDWPRVALGDALSSIDSGKSPVCRDRPAAADEWGVLKAGAVTYCEYDGSANKSLPEDVAFDAANEIRAGDLLFSRKNTRELVAACAYVYETAPRLLLSDLIFRLRVAPDVGLSPMFLHQVMVQPRQRGLVQQLAGGSAGSMPNVSKAKLRTVEVIRPPIELQEEFAQRAAAVRQRRRAMAQSSSQLDDLFASLQQRAFRGEL